MSQPQLINGQLCFNCTEVDRARRVLDPARAQEAKALGVDPSRILPDGQVKPKDSIAGASGVNQPLASGTKGRNVNMSA